MTIIEGSREVVVDEVTQASDALGRFIEDQARKAATEIGFGYLLTRSCDGFPRGIEV